MKKFLTVGLAVATLGSATVPATAHHSFAMFDSSQEIVIEGTVVRWNFSNPHTYMMIEDAEGTTWAFEGAAPASLVAQNPPMTGDTFPTGSPLTVVYCPLHDGRPGGAAAAFITEDGTVYTPADGGCRGGRAQQWPEWIEQGFRSLAEVEAAGATEPDE